VQPPFDEALNNASLCHYTWGALYHEGKPSQGAKQVYRWEKRDFNDIKYAVKPERIPMPPDWREGLVLEFDAPLTLVRTWSCVCKKHAGGAPDEWPELLYKLTLHA